MYKRIILKLSGETLAPETLEGAKSPTFDALRVEEVAQALGISKSHAYKVIHKLNAELREKGYLTISGRVNRNFFMEKFCYGKTGKEG